MSWKTFLIWCINAVMLVTLVLFPYNIIGCGPDADPYDYFTSFFNSNLTGNKNLKPFYYTSYRFLYHEEEPVPVKYVTSAEWTGYCGKAVNEKDAYEFVCRYAHKDLSSLYFHLEKKQPLKIPDSVVRNSMTKYFMKGNDFEALGYVMYAKQAEPFVTGDEGWEHVQRDSIKMARLVKNGQQLYTAAKKDFIRLRYAYQVMRLLHYSGRFAECIKWYEETIAPNKTASVLHELSLSLNAGAMARTGKRAEAAYVFSKLFAQSNTKKISNYMSFRFTNYSFKEREKNLQHCRNNEERANMMGLFALGDPYNRIEILKEIYRLSPSSPLLDVLAIREINKIEENYLTPLLRKTEGGKALNLSWNDGNDSVMNVYYKEARELAGFYHSVSQHAAVKNKGLYEIGAAYLNYITKNYTDAKALLSSAEKMALSPELKDQWQLTNILLTISAKEKIDAAFEEQILPSVQWLEKKAKTEKAWKADWHEVNQWKQFYRNLMSEILAQRYHAQGDLHKETLAIGAAEKIFTTAMDENAEEYYPYYGIFETSALNFLRYRLNSKQVEQLHSLMQSGTANKFEQYLIKNNTLSADDVKDFAGTAYLREFNLAKAEEWFKTIPAAYYKKDPYKTYMAANPFADLIIDTHAPTKQDTVQYSKLSFVQKIRRLEKEASAGTDNEKKAKACYEIAKGYYHMSYWGNSWMLTAYEWHSMDGLKHDSLMQKWEKEYYGVYKAEEYYKKAFTLGKDNSFKARCLFMAAKCRQKQIAVPQYSQYKEWEQYQQAEEAYRKKIFRNDEYFAALKKDYAGTAFYKEALNTCSYLKDFALKK
jgi:hypothetical protein